MDDQETGDSAGAHTPAVANIVASGDLDEIRTILGDRERIRYEGVIRPGIKIPKNSCSPQEKNIYFFGY